MVTLLRVLALAAVCLGLSAQPDAIRNPNVSLFPRWEAPSFTWTTNVPEFAVDIQWALDQWATGTPLTFSEGPGRQWLRIDMAWGDVCNIPNGTFNGHAHYPPPLGGMWSGTVHLNGQFYQLYREDRKKLRQTLIHEIGHALGLPHLAPPLWSIMSYDWAMTNADREPMLGLHDRLFIAEMYSPRRGSCAIGTTMWTCF